MKGTLTARQVLVALVLFGVSGYSQATHSSFEVASFKVAAPGIPGVRRDPETLTYKGFSLRLLLMDAYNIRNFQIRGPSWVDTEKYDLIAKFPNGTSRANAALMLQGLLKERLLLRVHHETHVIPVYGMITDKKGLRAKRLEDSSEKRFGIRLGSDGHLEATSLPDLAKLLTPSVGRPVLDMTGLEGRFDIQLDVSPGDIASLQPMREAVGAKAMSLTETDPSIGSSIFSAVRELGLRLEPRKAPIDHLVVDEGTKMPVRN